MERAHLVRTAASLALAGTLLLQPSAAVLAESDGPTTTTTTTPTMAAAGTSQLQPAPRARVSGLLDLALNADAGAGSAANTRLNGFFARGDECALQNGGNIKVNQNCLNVTDSDLQGRGQAQNETAVAVDPNNPKHLVASYNDYRRGDGTCGTSYSLDGGRTWNDSTAPNGFTRGTVGNIQPTSFGTAREYWQAGGDTSVAWDSRGNAYLSCQVFNRGRPTSPNPDLSSGFVVFRSTQNGGASWDFPGRYVIANDDVAGSGAILEDKQYLTVDNHPGSLFQDRLYVTWTEFTPTTAYIYVSWSADYGQTFSPKKQVSPAGSQPLCGTPLVAGGGCDNNQFSQPFTAPDGTLYVVWANYNTVQGAPFGDDNGGDGGGGDAGAARISDAGQAPPAPPTGIDNHFQILLAKSTDGGATFSAPVKVGDFFELPDCATYQGGQDAGRACVPEKGAGMNSVFRAANYPSGAVNPSHPNQVVVAYGSYISKSSNESFGCVPEGTSAQTGHSLYDGVKTAGACNNKIIVSVSTNAGGSFSGSTQDVRTLPTANPLTSQHKTDQWWQWLAFTPRGKLAISYYDRAYGDDETNASSDISLSGASEPHASLDFDVKRVTNASMPPPTEFPDAQGASLFWGDYAGLAAKGEEAVPIWSDTRDADVFVCPGTATPGHPPALCGATEANGLVANDQDIFLDVLSLPSR